MKPTICILRSNPVRPDSRVEKEAACLIEGGYKVVIIAWDRDDNYKLKNGEIVAFGYKIPIVWFGIKAPFGAGMHSIKEFLKFQYCLFRWLKNNRKEYNIIHACDFDTAFTALSIKKIYKKKLVFDIFDFLYGEPKSLFQRIIRGVQNKIINNADATIICTEERRKQIRDSVPKNLTIIHNTPPRIEVNNNVVTTSDKVKICYVGILQDWRLLEEIPQFFIENPNFEFHIGGFGKYENLYKEYSSIYPNIKYYGKLQYDKTLELESSCDIMLAIYDPKIENHRFAAPNKFYESLMLAKPLVMVKGTGMSKIVDDYNIGVTIDYSLEGFTSGIYKLIENKDLWPDMSKTMKEIYDKYYCWDEMKTRLLNLYSML